MVDKGSLRQRLDGFRNTPQSRTPQTRAAGAAPAPTFAGPTTAAPQAPGSFSRPQDTPPTPNPPNHYGRGTPPPNPNNLAPGPQMPPTGLVPRPQQPTVTPPVGGGQPQQTSNLSPYGQPLTGAVPQDQWGSILSANPQVTQQIQDMFLLRYGLVPGGEQTLVSLVNKAINEGYPLQEIQRMIENGYNQDDVFREAADAVQLEFGPQEAAARRAIEEILRQSNRDTKIAERTGHLSEAAIGRIYEQLANTQQGITSRIGEGYNQAGSASNAAYTGAADALRGFMDQGAAGIQAASQQAGAGDAVGATLARSEGQIAPEITQLLSNMGANGGQIAANGATQNAYLERLGGAQQMSGAASRSNVINEMSAAIGEILNQRTGAVNEQTGIISDIYANRGSAMRNAIDEIRERNLDRDRQEGLDALNERLVNSQIGATDAGVAQNQQRIDLESQRQIHDMAMDIKRFGLDEQQVAAQIQLIGAQIRSSGVSDEVARAQIQQILADVGLTEAQKSQIMAQIDLTNAQTAQTNADTEQTGAVTENIRNPAVNSDGTPVTPEGEEGEPFDPSSLSGISGAHAYSTHHDIGAQNLATAQFIQRAISQILSGGTFQIEGFHENDPTNQALADISTRYALTENIGGLMSELMPLLGNGGFNPGGMTQEQMRQIAPQHVQALLEILFRS